MALQTVQRTGLLALVFLIITSRTACAAIPPKTTHVVQILSEPPYFLPRTLSIEVGDVVKWQNAPIAEVHNIFCHDRSTTSGAISPGAKWQMRFTTPGIFNYTCGIHPWMRGSICVRPRTIIGVATPAPRGVYDNTLLPGIKGPWCLAKRWGKWVVFPVEQLAHASHPLVFTIPSNALRAGMRPHFVADEHLIVYDTLRDTVCWVPFKPAGSSMGKGYTLSVRKRLSSLSSDHDGCLFYIQGNEVWRKSRANVAHCVLRMGDYSEPCHVVALDCKTCWLIDGRHRRLWRWREDYTQEFLIPQRLFDSQLAGVTVDGRPWLYHPRSGVISALCDGSFMDFALPHGTSYPRQGVLTRDGRLWLSDSQSHLQYVVCPKHP